MGEVLTIERSEDEAFRAAFRRRVDEARFSFARQPIVDLASGRVAHDEVFVRFEDASPAALIARAEALGVIRHLDVAVVRAAVQCLNAAGVERAGLSLNVSTQTLADERAMNDVCAVLSNARFAPALLSFEITESAEIADLGFANAQIQRLRALGFHVSLDDFGAGYASISYLQALDVDCVKIDGRYVRGADACVRDTRLLRALIQMCATLDVATVAEMIETQADANLAQDLGVRFGQGYFYGRPAPAHDLRPVATPAIGAA
jgi:EAL domain-containing protein (putative c-di-GMP-specific phosphodiesterase class I)